MANVQALRTALGPDEPWRSRAEELARVLAATSGGPLLDVQRVFSLLPPDRPAGEAAFRLAEALPRTMDRASRIALLREYVPPLRNLGLARVALPVAGLAIRAIGGQFVYGQQIEDALARALRTAAREPRARFSFDMLGEGARTADDAARNFRRYAGAIEAVGRAAGNAYRDPQDRLGVSVKLSSIHARYDAQSYPRVRGELIDRLLALCRAGSACGIGLTIDAEESERLPLQLDLFAALASHPDFLQWPGLGLAVQAYHREILGTLDRIAAMARQRVDNGGKALCVRLVKGAYWDAEIRRAQELGLDEYPVFTDKRMTDLAYVAGARRLLAQADAVFPQFATHNPFTLGCILALSEKDAFECQRLHGMGTSLQAALARLRPSLPMRVYAPVGPRRELLAYLVRRLLENGASTSYVRQAARCADAESLLTAGFEFLSMRERAAAVAPPKELQMPERRTAQGYDLADPATLAAMTKAVAQQRGPWRAAPLVGGSRFPGASRRVFSPARPDLEIGEVLDASPQTAGAAIARAYAARTAWAATSVAARAAMLDLLADRLEMDLINLVALCVWEAGKTMADAVAEVREAVDFCRYYAQQARENFDRPLMLRSPDGESNVLTLHGRGVFACISPWNFPVAIFTGQVAAALVAGNTVVAKPAEQTPLTACRVAELVLDAGVPAEVFHLLPGDGASVGRAIVQDARVAGVAFTGSIETARAIHLALAMREGPIAALIAETGGLNAMIVDSTALPEQVVDAVVASAFRSAGQRCSSLRMLYLQHEIAPQFLELLRGAIATLRIGDPSDPATDIGPVIDDGARGQLSAYVDALRHRAKLIGEAGPVPPAGHYIAPVAFEVSSIRDLPGERFGPVLHVARFAVDELDRVIDDINATGYGLTMGVHTRLDSRAEHIRRRAAVGNLYVNRNMIGAVVGVQPFGGEGLSGTGPKAGGPHYLGRFATERVYSVNTAAAGGDLRLMTRAA